MADDAARLAEIERDNPAGVNTAPNIPWLIGMARRALQAESAIQTFLTDRAADAGGQAARDAVLIEETVRMVARECIELLGLSRARDAAAEQPANERLAGIADQTGCNVQAITEHFALDGGPTLTQRVQAETARECAVIAEGEAAAFVTGDAEYAAVHIATTIRQRFGLAEPGHDITPAVISLPNATTGIAGERIRVGETVAFGADGRLYRGGPGNTALHNASEGDVVTLNSPTSGHQG